MSDLKTENNYAIQLDGVRFVAVFMVMIAHWAQWQFTTPFITEFPFVHGVILFFVLSGFLITRILLKSDTSTISKSLYLRNFYVRRFLRIFPIYYALIITLFIINYKNTRQLFPWLITYSSNIYQSVNNEFIGDFNHFWSLAVEEQFYLLWPLIFLFVAPSKFLKVILSTILLSIFFRLMVYLNHGNWMMLSYSTPGCMYALGLGAILAYLSKYKPESVEQLSNPIWLYGVGGLYIASLFVVYQYNLEGWKQVGDEVFFSLLAMLIILRAAKGKFSFFLKYFLENKFINYAGRISYGLYVYHLFIPTLYYFLFPKLGISITNKYTLFFTFFLLTVGIAHLSWKWMEEPLNKLKSKFPYSG